jgi:hypothetical protein
MEQIPNFAINEFLEIIHAYGAFIKERELVKNFNKENKLSKPITNEISMHSKDPYSWESREYGVSSGISNSEIKEFTSKVLNVFSEEKELLTRNLISSEKYYKKLKHKFNEKYPELINPLKDSLLQHQKYVESKKRIQYQKHQSILGLSDRFISFFHYQSGGGNGLVIAYRAFANDMNKKYNIYPSDTTLHDRLAVYNHNRIEPLNIKEIEDISTMLKTLLDNVTEEDLSNTTKYINDTENGNISIPEKIIIANSIIRKNYARFKKLHTEYLSYK